MSRCFPYPPPGYSRNGATYEALIESIKLQKENEKAKSERKKEKKLKKEKKEKGKRRDDEKAKAKLQKNPNEYQQDAHNLSKGSVDLKEVHKKTIVPTTEQLERSDLTEEHGQPISSHKPSYSSDSTQNSGKRKREESILPENSSGHGKLIKIRLLKKQRPDSINESPCSISGRTDPLSLCVNTGPSVPPLVSRNGYSGVPATSGRENNAANGRNSLSQTKSVTNVARLGMKNNDPKGLHYGRQQLAPGSAFKQETKISNLNKNEVQPVPSRLVKSDMEGLHSSKRQAIPSHGRLVQSHVEHHEMGAPSSSMPPAPSVSRKVDAHRYGFGTSAIMPLNQLVPNSDLNNAKLSVNGKRSISEIYISGPKSSEKKKEDLIGDIPVAGQKLGLSKSEKKKRKKHDKYEKLMGSWVPPVLQTQLPALDDDEDWLSRKGKMGRCLSRNDVETCRDSAAPQSLWQPCARFLADADIYAMPYTVPF